jgi:outer membrane protein TolC
VSPHIRTRLSYLSLLPLAFLLGASAADAQDQKDFDANLKLTPASRYLPTMDNTAREELPKLRGVSLDNQKSRRSIEDLTEEATGTPGSIFVSPDDVYVKPPVLKSLITLNENQSPFALDATSELPVTLRDVMRTTLEQNLPIKITQSLEYQGKYKYYQALSNFLPTITNALGFQGLNGSYASPAGAAIGIRNPYFTSASGFNQYLFKGGQILFGATQAKHAYNAARYYQVGSTYDALLDAGERYYELVLNDVLLQIRVKSVEVSKALLLVNQDLFDNGANTQLDVLQAKYQLSSDRQNLIKQQVERRKSAVKLGTVMNMDQGIDLTISDRLVNKRRLVDKALSPADLLKIAIDSRPELKRYEELRKAARDSVKVVRGSLLPSVAAQGAIIGSGSHAVNVSNFSNSNQQTPVNSAGSGTGIGVVTSATGLPLATTNSTNQVAHWTTRALFSIGVAVEWELGGMGTTQIAQIKTAKWVARQAQLEFNDALRRVIKDVRDAYLNSLSAENLIIETTDAVKYSEEGLRLAETRFKEGVGTYIDVLNAQKSYTDSLINKAQAIVDFNRNQIRLLHAMGCLSVDTATAARPLSRR